MVRSRVPDAVVIGKSVVRRFKCERECKMPGKIFCIQESSVNCTSSPIICFKRSRKTQRWFTSNTSTNPGIQLHNQHLFRRKLSSPEGMQNPQYRWSNRLFTTRAKGIKNSGRQARKKKSLSPSNKALTTKDRLRLSSRPSSSSKNSQQNEKSTDLESMLIKSPEELMERLNSGLDIARAAVREGYASLRNPTNAGNKHGNHLLPARPGPSGTSEGSRPLKPEGLIMDANWWFWNLLFAASPSIVIALYCQYIVKPEMKIRYEERENEKASDANERVNNFDGGTSGIERRSNAENKMSPMRIRQEEQKHQEQKLPDSVTTRGSSSSPPPTSRNNLNEELSSFSRFLVSWFSGEQPPPTPASEASRSRENRTQEVEKSSPKIIPNAHQIQRKNETISLEIQQQELKELQSQLRMLEEKLKSQKQERADFDAGSDCHTSDVESENPSKRDPFLFSIGKSTKGITAAGINMGKERWSSFLVWLRNRGQPSDESSKSRGIDTGDGGMISRRNSGGGGSRISVDRKEIMLEKAKNAVPRAPTA